MLPAVEADTAPAVLGLSRNQTEAPEPPQLGVTSPLSMVAPTFVPVTLPDAVSGCALAKLSLVGGAMACSDTARR